MSVACIIDTGELRPDIYGKGFPGKGTIIFTGGTARQDTALLKALPMHHKDPFDKMLISQCINGVSDDYIEKIEAAHRLGILKAMK